MLSVLFCDQPGQQSRQFCKFSFLLLLLLLLYGLVFWPRLGDPSVCQSPIGVYVCYFLGQVLVCMVKFKFLAQLPVDPLAHPVVSCLVFLLCQFATFALLCDWWFRLCHHIAYIYCFIASYLFSLWYYHYYYSFACSHQISGDSVTSLQYLP